MVNPKVSDPHELKRCNPDSLVALLRMIRTSARKQHRSQDAFVRALNSSGFRFKKKIRRRQTLERLEDNVENISYSFLEQYAIYTKLTVGLLATFSRMLANRRESIAGKASESNLVLAKKIMEIMAKINDSTEFDEKELQRWQAIIDKDPLFNR